MMQTPTQPSVEQYGYKQELKRSLTFWDLVIYGLIFMVPIAPMGIYGYVAEASHGMVVLAYALGMVGMVFTAYSYYRMSEAFPVAGSVYTYAQRGIHPHVGFIAGWMILLDYILIPALLYVVAANALAGIVSGVPAWLWVVIFIVINTFVNIRGIELTAKANKWILIGQLIVLAIFVVVAIGAVANGVNGSSFNLNPIYQPGGFNLDVVAAATSIAVLSFLGFDAISTLSEETKGGRQTVGRATVWSLLLVGVLFMAQTYLAALIGPDLSQFPNKDIVFYEIAGIAGGHWLNVLTAVATVVAWGIADSLVAQAAISRILYSMSRDTMLPKFLSKIHPKYKSPYTSTLVVAAISLVVTQVPLDKLTALVNFGALTAFLFLNLSVVIYFVIKNKSRDYYRHLVMPLLGFIVVGYVWWHLDTLSFQLGGVWFVLGLAALAYFTKGFKKLPPALMNE